MELIKGLIGLVNTDKFTVSLKGQKKLLRLYNLLRYSDDYDNLSLFNNLYDKGSNPAALKQLKARLKNELVEHILKEGVKFKNIDSYTEDYRKCLNGAGVAKYLLFNAFGNGVDLAEYVIKEAIKGEYTEIVLLMARELFKHYSIKQFDKNKAAYYDELIGNYFRLYSNEIETQRYLTRLMASGQRLKGSNILIQNEAKEYADKVKQFVGETVISYDLILRANMILANYYEMINDKQELIELCDNASLMLEKRKVSRKAGVFVFQYYKLGALIHLQRYSEAESIIRTYKDELSPGGINWFGIRLYSIIIEIHKKNYSKAIADFKDARSNNKFNKQTSAMLQVWTIYEAYLEFCKTAFGLSDGQQFRLAKFLNEVPIYTKDKRGLNISILIIQVLFLLQQRKYSQIIDRAESLRLYCNRYLRKDETFRSNCFIWMLLQMPRADFNRIRTERYAEPYLKKLQSVPLKISQQTIEVEVIPYEDLWNITLDLLN